MNERQSTKRIALLGECMLELSGQAFGSLQQGYGGDSFNTATYLRRCARPDLEVSYATALGDDPLSDELVRRWALAGINTSLIRRIPGRLPGLYLIQTDPDGERHFSFWRESSAARAYFDIDETPLESNESRWDALYFTGISLAILPPSGRLRVFELADRLRQQGKQVIFDNNYRPALWHDPNLAREAFSRALQLASTALVTLDDHQKLFDDVDAAAALDSLMASAVPELVIKRGQESTLVRIDQQPIVEVATTPVAKVVDTTAAGDSFAAGYLSRRLAGETPRVAAEFGNRLAARVIQHPGALISVEAMADLMGIA